MRRRLSINTAATDTTTDNVVVFPKSVKAKNPAAVMLGKMGGSKGGTIRAQRLSPERRKTIAQQAAQARWAKARINEEAKASASRREGSG